MNVICVIFNCKENNMNLYIKIRNFDTYEGKNPFKIILKYVACKMWDYQDAKDIEYHFMNKKRTEIKDISFFKYLIMSFIYDEEE